MSRRALAYTVRRAALAVVSLVAFVAGLTATSASLEGFADAGVVPSDPGGVISSISPTGFAWRDGVRAGQHVVALQDSLSAGGWRLETEDSEGRRFVSRADLVDAGLRDSLPIAVGSMLLGGLAVVFVRTNRRWVAPLACLGLYGAAIPLLLQGDPALSTLSMAAAGLAPPLWFAARAPFRPWARLGLGALVVAFGAWWAAARLAGLPESVWLESARLSTAGFGSVAVAVATVVIPVLRGESFNLTRPRLADLAAIAVASGLSLGLIFFFAVSPAVLGLVGAFAVIALPGVRRFVGRRLEHLVLADVREHAAINAAEEERARMARELHDAPLQQLAGVIRRLELVPEAHAESEELRAVASELRAVATDLRPPVLDDLGLAAGLEFLAEESSREDVLVLSSVNDDSGVNPDERPPSEVELAMFRIAQEAVGNALRHANASEVRIQGRVGRDRVEMTVADDGTGLTGDVVRRAARRGRLGIASMRRRAEAIDADLAIDGTSAGTTIRIRWQR